MNRKISVACQSRLMMCASSLRNHPGLIIIDSEGIPIRTSMDNETTLHYAALISQLTVHAKRAVRELDSSQELEQLRKNAAAYCSVELGRVFLRCSRPSFTSTRNHRCARE